jgi:hypothetical protein
VSVKIELLESSHDRGEVGPKYPDSEIVCMNILLEFTIMSYHVYVGNDPEMQGDVTIKQIAQAISDTTPPASLIFSLHR